MARRNLFEFIKLLGWSPDIVIFLVGPTGSGKSTFINVVTNSTALKVGRTLEPCTRVVQTVRCSSIGNDHPRKALFVDTPAFDGIQEADLRIRDWLYKSFWRKPPREMGVLYLHDISNPRMTALPDEHILKFKNLCARYLETADAPLKVVIVTTMWGNKSSLKEAREVEIRQKCVIVRDGQAPMCRFLNSRQSAEAAVNLLLDGGRGISD